MDLNFKSSVTTFNVDEAQGIVECFVAAVGNKDSVGDIVMPGAFTDSLRRRKPRVVWGHDWNQPIGKVLEIYEVGPSDPRLPAKMKAAGVGGLFARVQFNLKSERGRQAFYDIAFFGEEQEWSIGYKTLDSIYSQERQANLLKVVELYEVSPVLHGANQLTATISIKSEKQDDKVDSFRKSKWKVFDPAFAEMIRTKHPDIWRKGGNIKGNDQYRALLPIYRSGGKANTEAEINALELREAWVARHAQDFRLAGVVAQIKWLAVGSRGEGYMKDVIREAIAKKEQKAASSHEEKSADPRVMELIEQLSGLLKDGDDDFDDMLGNLIDIAGQIHAEMEDDEDDEDNMEGDNKPAMMRRVLSLSDDAMPDDEDKTGDCGCGCDGAGTCGSGTKDATGPCWPGYEMVGMKKGKNGQMVPNCVPVKGKALFDGNENTADASERLALQVSTLIGRVVAFYFKSHAAHWNVEGQDFAQYHELFGEIYSDVQESIDGWAETLRKLGHPTPGGMFTLGMDASPEADITHTNTPALLVTQLIADNAELIESMKQAFSTADSLNEQGVANFIADRLDMHQKWQWFLRSSAKNAEIKSALDEIEVKAGRVIANRNMGRLRQALELIRAVVEEGDPMMAIQQKSAVGDTEYLVMDVTPESMFEIKSYLDDFATYHNAEVVVDEAEGAWIAIEAKSDEMMNVVLDFFEPRQDEFQIKGFFFGASDLDDEVEGKSLPFDYHVKAGRKPFQRAQAYDPDASDADGDQMVQDGTPWERPATSRGGGAARAAESAASGVAPTRRTTPARRNVAGKPLGTDGKPMKESGQQPTNQAVRLAQQAEVRIKPNKPKPNKPKPSRGTKAKSVGDARLNGLPGPDDFDQMKKIGGPLGSQGGGWFEDANGQKYLVKPAKSETHAQNELAAHLLYRQAGILTDDTGIFERDGKFFIAKRAVQSKDGRLAKIVGREPNIYVQQDAREGFAIDALASSWDVFGMTGDNVVVDEKNKLHRIDVGGSLQFRAQGGHKDSFAPGKPWVEPETMRNSDQGRKLYGEMTDDMVIEALSSLEDFDLEGYRQALEDAGVDETTQQQVVDTLSDRINNQLPQILDDLKTRSASTPKFSHELNNSYERLAKEKGNVLVAQFWDDLRNERSTPAPWSETINEGWNGTGNAPGSGLYASEDGSVLAWIHNGDEDNSLSVLVMRQDGLNLDVPDVFHLDGTGNGDDTRIDKQAFDILKDLFGDQVHHMPEPKYSGLAYALVEKYDTGAPPLNRKRPTVGGTERLNALDDFMEKITRNDKQKWKSSDRQKFITNWYETNEDAVANPWAPWLSDGQFSNGQMDENLWKEQYENAKTEFRRVAEVDAPDLDAFTREELETIMKRFGKATKPSEALLALLAHYQWYYS